VLRVGVFNIHILSLDIDNDFGRPFVKQFALCYRTVALSVCLSVCDVGAFWPIGWMDEDETWRAGRPRPWPYRGKWGPSSPEGVRTAPNFSSHVCCSQTARWIKMSLGTEVGLGSGDIVLDGDPAFPKNGG